MSDSSAECRACRISVRLPDTELQRILAQLVASGEQLLAPAEAQRRLALCQSCPDLQYGSTCRHCGCLVPIRTHLAGKRCPAPSPRW